MRNRRGVVSARPQPARSPPRARGRARRARHRRADSSASRRPSSAPPPGPRRRSTATAGLAPSPGRRPRFQGVDQFVRLRHPELGQPGEAGTVGAGKFGGSFGGFLLGGGEPFGCGLYLGGEPVLLGARRLQRPSAVPRPRRAGAPAARRPAPDGRRPPASPAGRAAGPAPSRRRPRGAPRVQRAAAAASSAWRCAASSVSRAASARAAASPARAETFLHLGGQPVTVLLPDARPFPPGAAPRRASARAARRPASRGPAAAPRAGPRAGSAAARARPVRAAPPPAPHPPPRKPPRPRSRSRPSCSYRLCACRGPAALRLAAIHRVPAVIARGSRPRPGGLPGQGPQRVAFLVQPAERLGDRRHQARAERGQRLGERAGQQLLVGPLGKLRLPELDQQVDQRLVAVFPEPEQGFVHRPPVVGGPVVHHARARRSPRAASPW